MIVIERCEFTKSLKNIKLIAHRLGYQMTPYPENSMDVLKHIFADEKLLDACDGFEFDICFTKDHIPVVVHDKYIDDYTEASGLINKYTIDELRQLKFGFRKSLKVDNDFTFKIVTLEELLSFFDDHKKLLKNKIIKIETKDYIFSSRDNLKSNNLKVLAEIINRYPGLSGNVVHLCFWPLNILMFRSIQKKKGYNLIKTDLLCDYSIVVFLTRFMPYVDSVSLRIKTKHLSKKASHNSKRVNKKIAQDLFFMTFSNALKMRNVRYALRKYDSVGLYTLNDETDIYEVCKRISGDVFRENANRIFITTNNPIYLKELDN